jgi:hypothetical protein
LLAEVPLTEPSVRAACARALLHAGADRAMINALAERGGPLADLAADVAGRGGPEEDRALLAALVKATPEGSPAIARAVGRIGSPQDAWIADRWVACAEPRQREEVAIAQLRLRGRSALASIAQRLADKTVLRAAALAADQQVASAIVAQAPALAGSPTFTAALGLTGDPAAVPWLLAALEGRAGDVAAEALVILTGASLVEEAEALRPLPDEELSNEELAARQQGDPRVGTERETVVRLCRDRARWTEALGPAIARLHPGQRHRGGVPATPESTLALLERAPLRAELRRLLAEELVIRWGVPLPFDPWLPVRRQRALFAAAHAWLDAQARPPTPGTWELAR